MTKIEEMRDTLLCDMERELKRVKADNAALREALKGYAACGDGCTCGDGWSHDAAREALSITKPSNYVSKDAVRPLAECLHHIKGTALNARCEPSITVAAIGLSAYGGVCVAIELGLLDK
jgi:hypothetical protein